MVDRCWCGGGTPPGVDAYFFRCMTTCGSSVSFFRAGFLALFNMRSSCQRHRQRGGGCGGCGGCWSCWSCGGCWGCGRSSRSSRAADTHLSGLVHLADHGADHVVGVVDERASVSVAPPLAVQGFPPRQHDVKVRHEAAAADKHLRQSQHQPLRSSDVGPEESLDPGGDSLLTAALQALVRV